MPISAGMRTFGCEFELPATLDRSNLIARLKQRGHRMEENTRSYTHEVTPGWKVVTDGSLSAGLELVSPVLKGERGLAEVMRMCQSLDALGVQITNADPRHTEYGFHVHVGVEDLDGEAAARLFCFHRHIEDQGLLNCVARSRRDSRWCKKTDATILERASAGPLTLDQARRISSDRYVALNVFGRCADYKTAEFRRHGGTLDGAKAVAWIILCVCMVTACSMKQVGRTGGSGLRECFRALGMFDSHGKACKWAAEYLLVRQTSWGRSNVSYPDFPDKAEFLRIR